MERKAFMCDMIRTELEDIVGAVSYTHLTLPTKQRV